MARFPIVRGRRLAAHGLIALVVAAGAGAGVAVASGGSGTPTDAGTTKSAPPPANGVPQQFIDAMQALVANGTIDQSQANVIDAQIRTGSMDSEQFVQSGLVTQSQMDAVNASLRTVKESLGQAARGSVASPGADATQQRGSRASAGTKAPGGDVPGAFIAAVQAKVSDGTITQAQADRIEAQVRAGTVDSQQLIDAGVVTAAQMA